MGSTYLFSFFPFESLLFFRFSFVDPFLHVKFFFFFFTQLSPSSLVHTHDGEQVFIHYVLLKLVWEIFSIICTWVVAPDVMVRMERERKKETEKM